MLLLTVPGMSFLAEGLGLSNTLGDFLSGVLLSETEYRHRSMNYWSGSSSSRKG